MHTARSLRSDRARTPLGRYVATEHAQSSSQLSTRYVATGKASEMSSFGFSCESSSPHFSFRLNRSPSLGSLLNPYRNAFRFVSIRVSVEILRRKQRPVRPQKGPSLGSLLNSHRNAFRFVSIGVSVEILRRKQRPVRPQKGPPLGSLLNPHRNAFRFVSIGVSVEILRRKQVGLFLACFYSLRSDLSDPQLATLRPFRLQRAPHLCSLLNPDRNAFRFVSIRVSVEILRQKQIRLTCIQIGRGQARVWQSDRIQAKLDRYAATKHAHSSVATRRPSMHTARLLRSDRASILLGRYVATEARAKLGRYVATVASVLLGRYVATEHPSCSVAT
ncbi:hypothetical protein IGI04_034068 [Brassica rapa subsp. trilocularis]|uniref:Uncharacterized protein n=1 Tax=Brassica rapa subsp. trilocularis TaxID=1813537 RepID=A0ABQ7L7Q2_BRACM|nr:hypothetical protein IGI04_034068 [Brassica rapa subsp. trilocularis]